MDNLVTPEDYATTVVSLIGSALNHWGLTNGSPTENTGETYENDVFLISAYDWENPDEDIPNFWYKPLNYQMTWYKYIGRGDWANKPITFSEAYQILKDCLASIERSAVPPGDEYFWQEDEE